MNHSISCPPRTNRIALAVLLAAALAALGALGEIRGLNAFASSAVAAETVEIEVACFKGGYGIDFFETCAREYEATHPGVKINLWGNPRVWEQILPRLAAGNPPDLCWPGWGLNIWPLIMEGQFLPLDTYLEQPAYGVDKPWKDTFVPSLLHKGRYGGHDYLFPANIDVFGVWYNKKMFREHGWTPPRTYEEFLELAPKIREAGIAPFTFTGRYPSYPLLGLLVPLMISAEGLDGYTAINNLEPGAWKKPGFLRAARAVMELKHKGYIQGGCIGMNHTESQMEFLVERVAMIPCGTWLQSEMKNLLPADFEMEFMRPLIFADGIGEPTAVRAGLNGKGWFIPTTGKHPDVAVDFFRYLSSPAKQKEFVETKGALVPVIGLGELNVPSHLAGPLKIVEEAKVTWYEDYEAWYPGMATAVQQAFRDLYNELLTPEEFLDACEAAAEAVRKNPDLKKFKVE